MQGTTTTQDTITTEAETIVSMAEVEAVVALVTMGISGMQNINGSNACLAINIQIAPAGVINVARFVHCRRM